MAVEILRGAKIRLYPNKKQREKFDIWRVQCQKLWNLLLGMEQAAYSGQMYKPELKWRKIWAEVARDSHKTMQERYEANIAAGKEARLPKAPELEKILPGYRGEPKLFIWQHDLMKIMARLKQVPHSKWIGDIHSHAAQTVVKDLIKALQAMAREKKKGEAGRDTGFPKFKKTTAYAEGSVYFANTQMQIDRKNNMISFPLGVGDIRTGDFGHIPKDAKLMGGRIFRTGEDWWLAAQFMFESKRVARKTTRAAGVKVAAKNVFTIYDGADLTQIESAVKKRARQRREYLASRRLSRRQRRSMGFYEASERLAQYHQSERNRRDDILHKGSRYIADNFDRITIDKMDVASLMKSQVKTLRKYNRNGAMARAAMMIKYKSEELGRTVYETNVLFPSTQICSGCGEVNRSMKSGKRIFKCGSCGTALQRQENAAVNEFNKGELQAAPLERNQG